MLVLKLSLPSRGVLTASISGQQRVYHIRDSFFLYKRLRHPCCILLLDVQCVQFLVARTMRDDMMVKFNLL